MQKGREVRDNIFEPRGFGDSGGFGFHSSMMPSLFGGRDPFDDPFFTDPFDSFIGPTSASRAMQKANRDKGIVIEELESDDEGVDNCPETGDKDFDQKNSKSTMEPLVEHPDDDDVNEGKNSDVTYKNDHYMAEPSKARSFSFKTSRVTYGGIDGAYYTSTRSRRMGADGVVMEENKEADTTTGQATHRITRGIRDKGHSVLRKLDSDGKVDTTQTLHNLNEDELAGFEEAWKGNNMAQLPGFDVQRKEDSSGGKQNRNQVWPLPYLEPARRARGFPSNYEAGTNSGGRTKKVVRVNIE
ncbi:myeloid leukemia factor [Spatholobus suberectus]|nr:myeloid leukemia factor [Spatholobus suberectus]